MTSTPEQIGETHSTIQIETPGAIYTSEPYDCGDPTQEAGGSITYDQCSDTLQEDSTYGEGQSPATPVYADPVDVEQTTVPTPILGTPTPIYKEYFFYTFWEWVTTGRLDASGNTNTITPNNGLTDQHHRVILESQTYTVVFTFKNGQTETMTSHDPALLQQYMLNSSVVGKFNKLGGYNGLSENKVLP